MVMQVKLLSYDVPKKLLLISEQRLLVKYL